MKARELPAILGMPLSDWPSEERPRERLRRLGAASVTDAELLAVLLGMGCVDRLRELIGRVGGLARLDTLGSRELCRAPGIGPVRASQIQAALEIGRRVASAPLPTARRLGGPSEVHAHLGPRLAALEREIFLVLALDTRHRIRGEHRIAEGHLGGVEVHPRELFRPLIRDGAAAAVLVHNHPSGDPTPSAEDFALTERMRAAGDLVGIPVLDHVIVARDGFCSLFEQGRLDRPPSRATDAAVSSTRGRLDRPPSRATDAAVSSTRGKLDSPRTRP